MTSLLKRPLSGRFLKKTPPEECLIGQRYYLRRPLEEDWQEWARLRSESRHYLQPWEPQWHADHLSRTSFLDRLNKYDIAWKRQIGYAFFIYDRAQNKLRGGISVSNLRRGVVQSANIGYWTGQRFSKNGVMTTAVSLCLDYCFYALKLRRIEAAILPGNLSSQRVLEKNGFQPEGLAREYIQIDGVWRDHLLYAVLANDQRTRYY